MKTHAEFRATYRLQLHKDFGFDQIIEIVDYLAQLGISHLYLSPIFAASPGSSHGYDGVDPTRVCEERGGESGFARLCAKLASPKKNKLAIVLDIVPNHLAARYENPTWRDVLRRGSRSPHWQKYDIRAHGQKLVLPVLGRPLSEVIEAGEFRLQKKNTETANETTTAIAPETATASAKKATSAKSKIKEEYVFEYFEQKFPVFLSAKLKPAVVAQALKGDAEALKTLAANQFYQLEEWRQGTNQINYRRFFDINGLACLRVEDQKVFEWDHSGLTKLMRHHDSIEGVRVDHVDGLSSPVQYLRRLRKITRHIWVEKVLGELESMPEDWPVNGTTGYDFMGFSTRMFIDSMGMDRLRELFVQEVESRWTNFAQCVFESKKEIVATHFGREFATLFAELRLILTDRGRPTASGTASAVTSAKAEEKLREAFLILTCSLDLYRTYVRDAVGFLERDREYLRQAFVRAQEACSVEQSEPDSASCQRELKLLKGWLLQKEKFSKEEIHWIRKWQQLTGPVMAKGLEDTALYRYFPLESLNVIGGDPDWHGRAVAAFHLANQNLLEKWPLTLTTLSTHDTKRSADVRARIHVLSEIPERWQDHYRKWSADHRDYGLSAATLYFIYEALLGAWPLSAQAGREVFLERMQNYFRKAFREAKTDTNRQNPNLEYETKMLKFVEDLLVSASRDSFRQDLENLAELTSRFGALNSLATLAVQCASPGVVDIYQGGELWDLSMADPDNRRPVDYQLRKSLLKKLQAADDADPKELILKLCQNWQTGEIKLWLSWKMLQLRSLYPQLFLKGDYIPIEIQGSRRDHLAAFARCHKGTWVLMVVPRLILTALQMDHGSTNLKPHEVFLSPEFRSGEFWPENFWRDTYLLLPQRAKGIEWDSYFTAESVQIESNARIAVGKALGPGPVGCLMFVS